MEIKYRKYDLIVIGSGPAGTPVVMEFAMLNPNKKILLVDKKGELGGECLFDGCIPSKILEVSGKHFRYSDKLKQLGVDINKKNFHINWKEIVNKKNFILNKRSQAAKKKLLSFKNVELVKASASFVDKNSVKIIDENNQELIIKFKKAVIGTGSRTFIPPFKGNGINKCWDNKTFFDNMELPKSLTIIGDGPIGIELSQILASLNVKINLIGNRENILHMIDEKYASIIKEKLEKDENINLILNSDVSEINFNQESNLFEIIYLNKNTNEVEKINSEKTLIATGRTPNIEGLNLENAGIKFEKRGIVVDEYLQTTNKNIYSAGDVALGFPQFAHTASYGAHIIAQNLFFDRNKFKTDYSKNSWVLFSEPNIVSAGINESQAKEMGIDYIIGEYDFSIDAKSQIEDEDFGYMKFIVNKKNLQVVGITIITTDANAISGEATLIVANKLTLKDLVDTIHPHPTLTESYGFLAKNMMGEIMKEKMKNPMFKVGFFIKKWF